MKKNLENIESIFGALADEAQIEIYKPRDPIINFSETITSLKYLTHGKAKVIVPHENGRESIVHFVEDQEYIGELTLIGVEKDHRTVLAISECECLSVPMERAKAVLLEDPQFLLKLSQYIGSKLLKRTWHTTSNQNYSLKSRLASYILLSSYKGIYIEKHTETANYLGVSYRHLLYTFKQLSEEGYIEKLKKGYRIHEEALKSIAIEKIF